MFQQTHDLHPPDLASRRLTRGQSLQSPARFAGRLLDGVPQLLEQSYGLRYYVYCVERQFLPAEDYPAQKETDEFDRYSVHIGAVDTCGELAGTVRLVRPSIVGLPLFRRCRIFGDETELYRAGQGVVEISRLAVSRYFRQRRDGTDAVVANLYKTVYQTSKRLGFTHWLAATEPSLQRLLARYRLPFRMIGPEIDYFGPVAPYLLDLADADRVILSGRVPILETWLDGLEPEFHPASLRVVS